MVAKSNNVTTNLNFRRVFSMAQSIFSHVFFNQKIRNTTAFSCFGFPSNFWIKQVSSSNTNIRDFSSHGFFGKQSKFTKLKDKLSKNKALRPPFNLAYFHISIRLKYTRKDPKPFSALLEKLCPASIARGPGPYNGYDSVTVTWRRQLKPRFQ